jgi:predicted urease superfamily metal-dependent hydrolase
MHHRHASTADCGASLSPYELLQNNQYSNKRWCCGDTGGPHIDISKEAFTQVSRLARVLEYAAESVACVFLIHSERCSVQGCSCR